MKQYGIDKPLLNDQEIAVKAANRDNTQEWQLMWI